MGRQQKSNEEVELNLAAMLDMAFQLLTFFILTFRPAPIEGQVDMRLPLPQPPEGGLVNPGPMPPVAGVQPQGLKTLAISLAGGRGGGISSINVGETEVHTLAGLNTKLRSVLTDVASPFEQVLVQVASDVRYDELMKVVEICSQQTCANGSKLDKLSFVEASTALAQ